MCWESQSLIRIAWILGTAAIHARPCVCVCVCVCACLSVCGLWLWLCVAVWLCGTVVQVARAWCGDTGSLPRSSFVDRVWAESKIFPKISEAASTPAPEASRGRFTVGQTVAAAVRPGDAHFPGTITAVHGDGTYDVTLDDDVGDTVRACAHAGGRLCVCVCVCVCWAS